MRVGRLQRDVAIAVMMLTLGYSTGCSSPAPTAAVPLPTLDAGPPPVLPYTLQIGDFLGVKFYQNPDLNEEVVVRPDGKITLQLIGDVQAAGLTPEDLSADLVEKYTGELATPRVTVIVRQFGGQRVYVAGEVGRQGLVTLVGGMTLYQAIQDAGGFLPSAHRKQVIVVRNGPDGKPQGHVVDLRPVEDGMNPSADVPLKPYDVVFIPRSKIADVNLFVEQYITKNIPPIPVAIPLN